MKMRQQGSKGCACGHFGKCIDIITEVLSTIAELAVRTGNVGVGVVDVAGEEDVLCKDAYSWSMRCTDTDAIHCLKGSAFGEGMDWMIRKIPSIVED